MEGRGGNDVKSWNAMNQTASSRTTEIEEDLSKLTVPALRERLRDFALPVGGKKAELIERLQSAMKDAADQETKNNIPTPAPSGYYAGY